LSGDGGASFSRLGNHTQLRLHSQPGHGGIYLILFVVFSSAFCSPAFFNPQMQMPTLPQSPPPQAPAPHHKEEEEPQLCCGRLLPVSTSKDPARRRQPLCTAPQLLSGAPSPLD